MAHIPGPWQVDETRAIGAYSVWHHTDQASERICSVYDGDSEFDLDRETRDANARLIAASPDLYAACISMLGYVGGSVDFVEAMRLIRDAVAKAEGTKNG